MKSTKCSCGCRSVGMFTIDRVNRLRRHFNLSLLTTVLGVDLHAALDVLDGAAKLLTRPENSQMRRSVILSQGQHTGQWYVGARLARLEAKVFGLGVQHGSLEGRTCNWALVPAICEETAQQPIGSDYWSRWNWLAYGGDHLNRPEGNFVAEPPSGAFSFWLGEMG